MWPHWLGQGGDSDEEDRRKRGGGEAWARADRFLGE